MSEIDEVKQRMKFLWAQGHYAEVAKVLWPAAEAIVEVAGIGPGMRVLDVAAGNGNVAVAAARKGASVVASDITPELVVQGRERTEVEGLDVEWREADAEDLPFEDESFDVVTSAFGAMFAPRAEQTAAELIRVTKPGGKVALTAWTPDGAVGKTFQISAKYMPPPPEGVDSPLSWGDEQTARARFAPLASSVDCMEKSVPWRFASLEEDREWAETNIPPIVVAKQLLPPETYEQFAAENLERVKELNTATDGSVAYDSEYLLTVATK